MFVSDSDNKYKNQLADKILKKKLSADPKGENK